MDFDIDTAFILFCTDFKNWNFNLFSGTVTILISYMLKVKTIIIWIIFRPLVRLPAKILLTAASVTELTRQKIGFVSFSSQLLSPSKIYLLSCTRTFNCSMAKTILGYTPVVRLEVRNPHLFNLFHEVFELVFFICLIIYYAGWCCTNSMFFL